VKLVYEKLKEKNIQVPDDDLIVMSSDLDEFPRTALLKNFKWHVA